MGASKPGSTFQWYWGDPAFVVHALGIFDPYEVQASYLLSNDIIFIDEKIKYCIFRQ